ncbi:DNA polymerase III subunit epsilon [Pacificimonas sp. ICDLI1SI03]|tara:strand:- start:6818 stop:7516 length:699 start_codon:yes stop_codon:yes gene_type:complete
MREIVFDTETTGLSPDEGHRIVEIGAIELDGLIPTGRTFHQLIHPERDMPAEAARIHGITMERLQGMPRFADIVEDFLAFIGDEGNLVAHNASFDVRFINHELVRVGRPKLAPRRIVDTLEMAKMKMPGAKLTLDALCNRFGVDLSRRIKHGALLDSELLADVYVELCGGRQRGMELVAEAPRTQVFVAAPPQRKWPQRTFSLPPEEAERHRVFVGTLTNPVWQRFADTINP